MARLLRAALAVPTLVLAHQLVFLARYGSVYGEALAHEGHGPAWTDAVAAVAIGTLLLLIAAMAGIVRLARRVRNGSDRTGRSDRAARAAPVTAEEIGGVARRGLGLAVRLTAIVLVALTVQENLEHAAAGFGLPGIAILLSPEYPFAVAIVAGVALAVALVATLLTWRHTVLATRLRAMADRAAARRTSAALPRPAADPRKPRPGTAARQLGRRAPPAFLPA
ncbi:MAG TPA: hypothetical protein VGI98_08225 [Candidatus Limnocylindrales bacterium]|jgi:hypothetical protein